MLSGKFNHKIIDNLNILDDLKLKKNTCEVNSEINIKTTATIKMKNFKIWTYKGVWGKDYKDYIKLVFFFH